MWSTHRKVIGDHHIPLVGIKIANADGYIFVLAGRATHSSKKYGDSYLSKVEDGKSCRMFKATSACSDVTFCERGNGQKLWLQPPKGWDITCISRYTVT